MLHSASAVLFDKGGLRMTLHVAGVLYWLGTGGPERRRHSYRNPAKDGKVAVVASHSVSSSTAHWMFVGRSNARAYIDCRHPGALKSNDSRPQ